MDYKEFTKRVKHNTRILKHALDNDTNLVTIVSQFYTWQSAPGELHFSVLMRNLHDIIPSVFLGALANLDNNGIDSFIVNADNTVEHLEMKTSEIASKKVWKGALGGLCVGIGAGRTQRQAITSALSASYNCHTHENLLSKNMRTVLFITDTDNLVTSNTYIDAWELSGEAVIEYLQLSTVKKRDIKFSSFMKNGFKAKTVVPLVGFEKLKKTLEKSSLNRNQWLKNNGYSVEVA
tara:strand:- start:1458 stop:2162 length:705 start_codon:yes stop_codon:yes gene_type:complete